VAALPVVLEITKDKYLQEVAEEEILQFFLIILVVDLV
jgi:hypothetical protein